MKIEDKCINTMLFDPDPVINFEITFSENTPKFPDENPLKNQSICPAAIWITKETGRMILKKNWISPISHDAADIF
jgi:hypothetical protein